MTVCTCLKRDEIGPSVPREYATWLVAEWRRECPEHQLLDYIEAEVAWWKKRYPFRDEKKIRENISIGISAGTYDRDGASRH